MSRTGFKVSRRSFIAGAGASVGTLALGARGALDSTKPPNVLFLMTDEHSTHALNCYGNSLLQTPTLDSLAESGQLFTSAYCQNPICVPSRASFVTGRMPCHVGVFGNASKMTSNVTMATVFRAAGYDVEWLGKTHWGGGYDAGFGGLNKGVVADQKVRSKEARLFRKKIGRLPHNAAVSPFPLQADDDYVTTDHAIKFLEGERTRPFFLGVSLRKPHFAFDCNKKYFDIYNGKTDCPHVTGAMLKDLPRNSRKEREKYKFGTMTDAQIKKARAVYFGMVTFIDEQFGRILNVLDKQGLRENTIILYTSDHGDLAGEHGLWYKNSFYEGAANVPFIWSFPKRLPQKKRLDAKVMNLDIFPTLCELCDVRPPKGLEGVSMVGLMSGREDGKERIALSENYRGGEPGRMIRKGKWKYCWYANSPEQLYDLEADVGEEKNLAKLPQHRKLIRQLKEEALNGFIIPKKFKA